MESGDSSPSSFIQRSVSLAASLMSGRGRRMSLSTVREPLWGVFMVEMEAIRSA